IDVAERINPRDGLLAQVAALDEADRLAVTPDLLGKILFGDVLAEDRCSGFDPHGLQSHRINLRNARWGSGRRQDLLKSGDGLSIPDQGQTGKPHRRFADDLYRMFPYRRRDVGVIPVLGQPAEGAIHEVEGPGAGYVQLETRRGTILDRDVLEDPV